MKYSYSMNAYLNEQQSSASQTRHRPTLLGHHHYQDGQRRRHSGHHQVSHTQRNQQWIPKSGGCLRANGEHQRRIAKHTGHNDNEVHDEQQNHRSGLKPVVRQIGMMVIVAGVDDVLLKSMEACVVGDVRGVIVGVQKSFWIQIQLVVMSSGGHRLEVISIVKLGTFNLPFKY